MRCMWTAREHGILEEDISSTFQAIRFTPALLADRSISLISLSINGGRLHIPAPGMRAPADTLPSSAQFHNQSAYFPESGKAPRAPRSIALARAAASPISRPAQAGSAASRQDSYGSTMPRIFTNKKFPVSTASRNNARSPSVSFSPCSTPEPASANSKLASVMPSSHGGGTPIQSAKRTVPPAYTQQSQVVGARRPSESSGTAVHAKSDIQSQGATLAQMDVDVPQSVPPSSVGRPAHAVPVPPTTMSARQTHTSTNIKVEEKVHDSALHPPPTVSTQSIHPTSTSHATTAPPSSSAHVAKTRSHSANAAFDPTPDASAIAGLTRSLEDVGREITTLAAREKVVVQRLAHYGVHPPPDPSVVSFREVVEERKATQDEISAFRAQLEAESEARRAAESALQAERRQRELAEGVLADVRRECTAPLCGILMSGSRPTAGRGMIFIGMYLLRFRTLFNVHDRAPRSHTFSKTR
ncbi:uncharacterized protein B0H18DRAFT_1047964 [Fomitopsis serialis]|uniref:uncharacterized protein n=1 Tax=Fomitopsis serialis TaxID=139415 RepID=UPI0020087366|nr:uncharacterized protein B0H18DRAFT_1047964 [Neoantrodia serialis]KAH9913627.1 hypothetical protein B0H18DRAFT_1047964 [Neoantrodia serialis]